MEQPVSRRTFIALSGAALAAACASETTETAVETKPTRWSSGVNLPIPAQEIYPARHAGAIHLVGGFIAADGRITGPTTAHHRWTPGDSSWTTATPLPTARHHPQLASFDGRLVAIAGFESPEGSDGWVMQAGGWSLEGDNWQEISELPAPCGEAVVAVMPDGALHLAGGRTPSGSANSAWPDHADTDHHYVLTNPYGAWERAAPCLTKRNSAAGDLIDGQLHIVGGRTVGGGNVAAHEVYDPAEDRWRTAAPMPQAQGGLAAAALRGKLYAFGGEYFNNGGGVYPEAWAYAPSTDSWTPLPDMPTPRHGLGAVALEGAIHVIGGAEKASGVDTSAAVEVFTPQGA